MLQSGHFLHVHAMSVLLDLIDLLERRTEVSKRLRRYIELHYPFIDQWWAYIHPRDPNISPTLARTICALHHPQAIIGVLKAYNDLLMQHPQFQPARPVLPMLMEVEDVSWYLADHVLSCDMCVELPDPLVIHLKHGGDPEFVLNWMRGNWNSIEPSRPFPRQPTLITQSTW